jgi:hypothetical protein
MEIILALTIAILIIILIINKAKYTKHTKNNNEHIEALENEIISTLGYFFLIKQCIESSSTDKFYQYIFKDGKKLTCYFSREYKGVRLKLDGKKISISKLLKITSRSYKN